MFRNTRTTTSCHPCRTCNQVGSPVIPGTATRTPNRRPCRENADSPRDHCGRSLRQCSNRRRPLPGASAASGQTARDVGIPSWPYIRPMPANPPTRTPATWCDPAWVQFYARARKKESENRLQATRGEATGFRLQASGEETVAGSREAPAVFAAPEA